LGKESEFKAAYQWQFSLSKGDNNFEVISMRHNNEYGGGKSVFAKHLIGLSHFKINGSFYAVRNQVKS